MQSVPITTKVVSSNPAYGDVYSIQHYRCTDQGEKGYLVVKETTMYESQTNKPIASTNSFKVKVTAVPPDGNYEKYG
jgi:hypothetical protein